MGPIIIALALGLMWLSQSQYKDYTMKPTERLNTIWKRDFQIFYDSIFTL